MDADRTKGFARFKSMMRHPAVIALLVAIFGIAAMLVVDHGPLSKAKVQPAQLAMYRTTGEAAQSAGATVSSTAPKSPVEPERDGPRTSPTVNPVIP